jgi:hypothetical protein
MSQEQPDGRGKRRGGSAGMCADENDRGDHPSHFGRRRRETYLGALVGDHSHGGATDVAGTHAADLDVPFFSHVVLFVCWKVVRGGG